MGRYVALLRGINVGGKNMIKMAELKACFEEHGFQAVATYIASGNVLFESTGSSSSVLTRRIEEMLSRVFGYRATVVVRSRAQLRSILDRAPDGYGTLPTRYHYDVVFLKPPLTARTAITTISTKEGVDEVSAGPGVLYFSRLSSKLTQSRLNRVASIPQYKNMTLRTWTTTVKLGQLLEAG